MFYNRNIFEVYSKWNYLEKLKSIINVNKFYNEYYFKKNYNELDSVNILKTSLVCFEDFIVKLFVSPSFAIQQNFNKNNDSQTYLNTFTYNKKNGKKLT